LYKVMFTGTLVVSILEPKQPLSHSCSSITL
jgi:hypothetical protein